MKNNDELMRELLTAKANGEKIFYAEKGKHPGTLVEDDHAWDLAGLEYKIRRRREFIIKVRDGDHAKVEHEHNNWTRSDFGTTGQDEYVLMREVYQDEM